VLRVAEQAKKTDTGRARRANEDSYFASAPLFVVADGMGGAQAGEVASGIAVKVFSHGLPDSGDSVEARLAARVREANTEIHELSRRDAERAGMGTTLTAAYVGEDDVTIAHVGDSRAYRWRDGTLERLTDDHSLVEELMRQGRLTAQEAGEHPQRSIITRALGPEPAVEVDTRTVPSRPGDVFLLCSDGLTSMISEETVAAVLRDARSLDQAGRALVDAANDAGGRDNITVLLFRVDDIRGGAGAPVEEAPTASHAALSGEERVVPRTPQAPRPAATKRKRRGWSSRLTILLVVGALLAAIGLGLYAGVNSVYFVGTDDQGRVALFRGLPYDLPLGISLYRTQYRSGIPASSLAPARRDSLLDHKLRSHSDATDLVRQLELGQLQGS
jgi:protein phosphatase